MASKPSICFESNCALAKIGTGYAPVDVGSRYESTRLLCCGEAPGEQEAREGLPFRPAAQAGSLFADACREVQISRSEMAVCNVLSCRPPRDWLEGAPYASNAIYNCSLHHLERTIRELQPRVILALGGTAMRALMDVPKGRYGQVEITRGFVYPGKGIATGALIVPTIHPAFARRGNPQLTPQLQRDIRRAFLVATGKLIEGQHYALSVEGYDPQYLPRPTLDEALEWESRIDPSLPIIYDIETKMSSKTDEEDRTSNEPTEIKLVQFTQHRKRGIALPWRDEYVDIVRRVMVLPNEKAGHNSFAFDNPILAANGVEIRGELHDTMVLYGFYWSDLPRNLQSCAQMAGFPMPWKAMADEDLETYGCFDVDATLCVYQYMRGLLEREGSWDSYRRYFAQVWPILRDMSKRGIPISDSKRLELKSLIAREDRRVTAAIQEVVPPEVRSNKQKSGLKRTPKDTTGMVEIEVVIEKEEKCQCLKKERPSCPVCLGSGIVPAGTVLKRWAEPVEFNPNSSHQVKRLIKFLKHPVPKHDKRTDAEGNPDETTEVKQLQQLAKKTGHKVYDLLIEKRQLTKVDGVYCEGWAPGPDGRVHTTFTIGQTATWQTSSKNPNTQNGIQRGKTEFQSMLAESFNRMQQAEPGHMLVNFDFRAFHVLTTGFEANSAQYMRLAKLDMHTFVTSELLRRNSDPSLKSADVMFVMKDDDLMEYLKWVKADPARKRVRDAQSKPSILGVGFGLGVKKLYTMNQESFRNLAEAQAVRNVLEGLFPEVFRWQKEIKIKAADEKKLVSRFGAIRHFWDVQRWSRKDQKWVAGDQAEQAIAFLPANDAFGHIRWVLLNMEQKGYHERYQSINTIHDSIKSHCPVDLVDECKKNMVEEMQKPSPVLVSDLVPAGLWVEAEATSGPSNADLH